MNDRNAFLDHLQLQINNEARRAFGERGFERWRNPRFQGRMENPDAAACVTGSCGDTMEMYLKLANGRVTEASYFTDGCASSSICGSFAAELAVGMDPDTLADLDGEAVLQKIGRLPKGERHCADLAAAAVREALSSYMKRLTKPSSP